MSNTFIIFSITVLVIFIIIVGALIIATLEVNREQKKYNETIEADSILKKGFPFLVIALLFSACTPTARMNHYQKIHGIKQSGTYTIKSYSGMTATFYEFPGEFVVPSDTLKKGDKIFITVVRPVKTRYAKNN